MASYSAARSLNLKVLTTTTVDSCTLTDPFSYVDVHNVDGDADLYVTANAGSAPSNPTVGDDSWWVPAGRSRTVQVPGDTGADSIVKVLGNGNTYTVEGSG